MCVSCGQSLVLLVVLCLCETTHRFQRWNLLRNNMDVRYVSYSTSSPPSNSSVLFDVKSACFLWLSLNKTFLMHDDEVSVISELQWNFKKTKNLLLLLSLMQTPQLPGRKRKNQMKTGAHSTVFTDWTAGVSSFWTVLWLHSHHLTHNTAIIRNNTFISLLSSEMTPHSII